MTKQQDPTPPNDPNPAYGVGYGRPPAETRFQPGKSGNPRGRPKGKKSIGALLDEALSRWVTVQENGRPRKLRVQNVIIKGLVNDAARQDRKAIQILFALIDRYGDGREQDASTPTMSADDEAIIAAFIASSHAQRTDDSGATPDESSTKSEEDSDDPDQTDKEPN